MFSGLKVTRVRRQAQSHECVLTFRLKDYRLVGSLTRQKSVLISGFTPKTRLGLFVRDLALRATSISFVSNWLMRRFVTDQFELQDYPG